MLTSQITNEMNDYDSIQICHEHKELFSKLIFGNIFARKGIVSFFYLSTQQSPDSPSTTGKFTVT